MHSLIADGALGPALVAEGEVVQHAWPAEDVAAACDLRRHRRIQADGAGGHLVAVDPLQADRGRGEGEKCEHVNAASASQRGDTAG